MSARIERLVNLLAALIDAERPLSRAAIQQKVPGYSSDEVAFRRAFERDKESLRAMGVPLTTVPLDPVYPEYGEGYRVPPEEYYLPDPGFTHEELTALALAASAVKLQSQSASAALWKLGADVDDVTPVEDVVLPESDELATVFAARRERRTISFAYKNQVRSLDPYRLTFRNGRWYVNGYDHGHDDVRTYRLDRMTGDITTGDRGAFTAPPKTDQPWLPPWRMGDEAPVIARVWIDATQAGLAILQAGEQTVAVTHDDGSIELELETTNRDALRSFVLGFMEHAEVLAPQDLRTSLFTFLTAALERTDG